ncbi:hypothetical protein EDB83DRAFT_2525987 [Lactarius deliciosus]|nr:hypothetical protein EDB83DRAFT_2525987 [Lactarius deliciosus]
MLPHADLHKTHGWPIVLYDQLGTGESTRKPPGFYTAALSVAKLDNLIQHLRIERDFDLLGHSWGVTLGIDEFVMTGVLKDWSVNPKLGKVSWPTLIINGADDAVQDCSVAPLFYGIEKAKWPEKYFGILGDFLADANLGNGAETQEV